MSELPPSVVNSEQQEEHEHLSGDCFGGYYRVLTPGMRPRGGRLGVNLTRLPPGRALCPFHYHHLEDEAFYILSGTGVLRYGEELVQLRPGDCVSCPAGTKVAHQIANNGAVDLVYLAVGNHESNEVCVYPDSGKVMVRSERSVGRLQTTTYMDGEPERPKIFAMAKVGD